MPNWKKVITSGSNAHLNQITASATIHGNQIVGGSLVYDTAGNIVAYGDDRKSIIIQTSNNNNDAGIAFRNSGGSYSNNIYRTNIGDSDADLRIAGGNTQGTITNLDDYVAIKGGTGATAGFVGIGNNEPSKKLTVAGDISASGDVIAETGSFNHLIVDGETPVTRVNVGDGLDVAGSLGPTTTVSLDLTEVIDSDGANRVLTSNGDGTLTAESALTVLGQAITASGNISASGDILGNIFKVDGDHNLANRHSAGIITLGNTSDKMGISATNIELSAPVTASGNISSSITSTGSFGLLQVDGGDFTSASLASAIAGGGGGGDVSLGDNVNFGHITASGDISASSTTATHTFGGQTTVNQITASAFQFVGSGDAELEVQGHITASGEISASGDVYADQFYSRNVLALDVTGTNTRLGVNATTTGILIGKAGTTTKITTEGNITASGDISSSGTITMLTASIGGGIFTSASLAAGGGGGAVSAVANGVNNRVATFSSADALNGESGLTFDGNDLAVNRDIDVGRDINIASGINHTGDSNTSIRFTDDDIFDIETGGEVTSFNKGHITASGDISSSGVVLGQSLKINGTTAIDEAGVGSTLFRIGAFDGVNNYRGSSNFEGNITSSGNITTGGDISGSGALFIGQTDGAFISASTGALEISGSGRGQLEVDFRFFDTGSTHLSSDGGAIGDIVKFGGSSTNAGDIYYLKTDGTWDEAQANAVGTSTGSLAVALGSNSTTDGMLLRGMVKLDNDPSATIGNPVFLDDTAAGHARNDAPDDGGDVVRIVGHSFGNSGLIYFNPDNTFIEVA